MPFSKQDVAMVNSLCEGILSGNRSTLAKAITLAESTAENHQQMAAILLSEMLPHSGRSIRIGVTGSPGAGKSTFINAFGDFLIQKMQKKVAVLAIDPSSTSSHGSILGDKTRMQDLAISDMAFVRPSPNAGDLGGVAARTRESILLCEAAGYDVVLIETVGVGQSEIAVHDMVDFFLLILLPGAGDELQGIKRGIVEMADLIVVNKADGAHLQLAQEASNFYKQALQLSHSMRPNWQVDVLTVSSEQRSGLGEVWNTVLEFEQTQKGNDSWQQNRSAQNVKWFDAHINQVAMRKISQSADLKALREKWLEDIASGKKHPLALAEGVVKQIFK